MESTIFGGRNYIQGGCGNETYGPVRRGGAYCVRMVRRVHVRDQGGRGLGIGVHGNGVRKGLGPNDRWAKKIG